MCRQDVLFHAEVVRQLPVGLWGGFTCSLHREAMQATYHIGVGTVVLIYIVGGLLVGIIVGLLAGFTRTRVGAALVGITAATPLSFLYALTQPPDPTFAGSRVSAVALGAGMGWVIWPQSSNDPASDKSLPPT